MKRLAFLMLAASFSAQTGFASEPMQAAAQTTQATLNYVWTILTAILVFVMPLKSYDSL